MVDHLNPQRYAASQKMGRLRQAGWDAYAKRNGAEAAELYYQGLKLAEMIGDARNVVYFRFWYGVSLSAAGRNLEALAALTPTLRDLSGPGRPADVHNTVSSYIDIAMEIPLDLDAIRGPLQFCEQYLERIGRPEWRHQLLFLQARLLEEQGQWAEALAQAEVAWAEWWANYPYFTADSHLERMVGYAIRLRNPQQAAYYLDVWRRNNDNEMPLYRRYSMALWQVHYHRLTGELDAALKMALHCQQQARQIDKIDHAQIALAAVYVARGELQAARDAIRPISLSHLRKHPGILLDYHVGAVRDAAGMAPADDQYDQDFPPPTTIADPTATRCAIHRARLSARLTMNVVRRWDEAFHCDWRQQEVADRLERLRAIEARLGP